MKRRGRTDICPTPALIWALLAEAHRRGRDVVAPTVACAEVVRGAQGTRALEAAVARHDRMVDAHVVAVCLPTGGGLVVTGDPDDIATLAGAVPAARIGVTRPD